MNDINTQIQEIEQDLKSIKESQLALSDQIRVVSSAGDNATLRVLATNFVRLREQEKRLNISMITLRNTSINIQNIATSQSLQKSSQAIAAATSLANHQETATKAFAKERQKFSLDMVQDTMDAVLDDIDDTEEESNTVMQHVYDAVNREFFSKLKPVPGNDERSSVMDNEENGGDELLKQLASLKAS